MNLLRIVRFLAGVVLIVGSLWVLDSQNTRDQQYTEAIPILEEAVREGIPVVTADKPEPSYEGQWVLVRGELEIGPVHDPVTGISLKAGGIQRKVEMLQWKEERFRSSGQDDWDYRKVQTWSDRLIDHNQFEETVLFSDKSYENPEKMPYDSIKWIQPAYLILGQWPLEWSYTDHLANIEPMTEELMSQLTPSDDWTLNGTYFYPSQGAGEIGATRISYEYFPLKEEFFTAIGVVKEGRLDDNFFGTISAPVMMVRGHVMQDEVVSQTIKSLEQADTVQNHWIGYCFAGWLLVIGVVAHWFPAGRKYTEAPFSGRIVMSIVIAAVATVALGAVIA